MYQHIRTPAEGSKIRVNADFSLDVPDIPSFPLSKAMVSESTLHRS